ncbi:TorD/DmsD family molecular chaperone [Paraferrimonas sedimenticola]|uniref:Chaperone TorD involved in molybdoenzyme TorA maturation n=1 Tax=Paraferrimonas sedimenticola TaxID=375674 RepID=A0AA37RXX6_9GAMM|nr:molecular chaperone TorD family protein [Paraferrimonas sedimenticola]GLP97551.1 hypothetical protein GCM10007895_28580 [Paraferrimonas sedimenticola]
MTVQAQPMISENDQLRADIYQIIAALFRQHPSQELLNFLAEIEVEQDGTDIAESWNALKLAAQTAQTDTLEDEYFDLFIGVGRGELLPYGSYYITGSLMDKPLALLRQDLSQLGFERQEEVKEPEDHVAALCEVMSALLLEAPKHQQLGFYQRHLSGWIARFCQDVAKAKNASFYAIVGQLADQFFAREAIIYEELSLATPVTQNAGVAQQPEAS